MLDSFWGRRRRRHVVGTPAAKVKQIATENELDARTTTELMRISQDVPEEHVRDLALAARAFGHRFAGFSRLSERPRVAARQPPCVVRARPRRAARAPRRSRRVAQVRVGRDPDPEPEPPPTSSTDATSVAGGRT